jgi:hypothetical protein
MLATMKFKRNLSSLTCTASTTFHLAASVLVARVFGARIGENILVPHHISVFHAEAHALHNISEGFELGVDIDELNDGQVFDCCSSRAGTCSDAGFSCRDCCR